jgi:hypothetical protein
MLEIEVLLVVLAVIVTYFLKRPKSNDPVRGSIIDIENYIKGLMETAEGDGVLIVTITGTSNFVQFTGGVSGVQMDFPLVTSEQKSLQVSIESVGKEMALAAIINSGSDGSEFIDFNLEGSPSEITNIVENFMASLYGTNQTTQLEFKTYGY